MAVKRIVILASGRGSNFAALSDAVSDGKIGNAEVVGLICNKADAPVLELARARGIPSVLIESKKFAQGKKLDRVRFESVLLEKLGVLKPDFICLAGYMLLLGEGLIERYPGQIVNIHPSLLPAFKGLHAIRQALEAQVKEIGCTVHLVTKEMDAGPILAQTSLKVEEGDTEDTLAQKLRPMEHATFIEAVRKLCAETYEIQKDRVVFTSRK